MLFFSAWRVRFLEETISGNMSLTNDSSVVNMTKTYSIPDDIWGTRVGVFGIGGTAVAVFGMFCNTISIIVLGHFRQRSSAPFLLICLEMVDTLLLFSEMMLETLTTLSQAGLIPDSYRIFIKPIYVLLYPVPHIAQTGTTMLTVLITIERYIAVAKPLLASRVCSKKWAWRAVVVTQLWAVLFQIPLYVAYTNERVHDPTNNVSKIVFYRTEFGLGRFYNYWFVVWINFVCEFLVPFVVIVVLNVLMIRALRASSSFTPAEASKPGSRRSAREGRLTAMVIAVTVIFFVCELFPALSLILVRGKDVYLECSVPCNHFVSVSDTMVMVNSASNFVVYCAIGKQFRDIFVKIFFRGRRRSRLPVEKYRLAFTNPSHASAGVRLSENGHNSFSSRDSDSDLKGLRTGGSRVLDTDMRVCGGGHLRFAGIDRSDRRRRSQLVYRL